MLNIVIGIHIFVSICLIFAVLLHSGKGAGLSSAFGGALPSSLGGTTLVERNLNRITIALSVVFTVTSIVLYVAYKP